MSIPNVAVDVDIPNEPVIVLLIDGKIRSGGTYEFPENTRAQRKQAELSKRKMMSRNWRDLRFALLRLEMQDRNQIARWLASAGYSPDHNSCEWSTEQIGDELVASLQANREIIRWLMGLEVETFRMAVKSAHEYFEELQAIQAFRVDESYDHTEVRAFGPKISTVREYTKKTFRNPKIDFLQSTGAPSHFDPWLLCQYLMGTGIAPRLLASFMWDESGHPKVKASVGTPLEAIGLSVHIDRNFSVRQWMICANERCKKDFERDRGSGRFCSERCKNYVLTNRRRTKIRLLREAEQAWQELPSSSKKRYDRWDWIAGWATKLSGGEFEVAPSWAKEELAKVEMKARQQ